MRIVCVIPESGPYASVAALISGAAYPGVEISRCVDAQSCLARVRDGACDVVVLCHEMTGRGLLSERALAGFVTPVMLVDSNAPAHERAQLRARLRSRGAFLSVFLDDLRPALLDCIVEAVVSHREILTDSGPAGAGRSRERFSQHLDRQLMLNHVNGLLRAAPRGQETFALFVAEIDRFKVLRETLGSTGIKQLIDGLRYRFGEGMTGNERVAYLEEGRFALLGPVGDHRATFEHLRKLGLEPFVIDGHTVYATLNVGVTSNKRPYTCAEDVIRDGIIAARKAAEQTGDQVFKTQMRMQPIEAMRLEMDLRAAVDAEAFSVHYQPIVDLHTRQAFGFEALMRWEDQRRGRVSPAEFIPVAEHSGLIIRMGKWVLGQAARQIGSWNQEFQLNRRLLVSVNVSAKQLCQPQLVEDVRQVLVQNQLDPTMLKIEFTETAMAENPEAVADVLGKCRQLGVQVWVDDFGTGYSSLAYIQRFPIDGLKLDKSFVDPIDGSPDSATMARAILELARGVGVSVVAEGVETEVQAEQLRQLGCRWAQGYLFSRPLPVADAYGYIANFPA